MLIVNEKILDLSIKDGGLYKYVKDYRDKVDGLRKKYGDVIRFVRAGAHKRNPSGLMEPVVPWTIPYTQITTGFNGETEVWKYSSGVPKKVKDTYILPENSYKMMDDWIVSLRRNADLAYFIVYKTSQFKDGTIYIDDPTAEAKKKAQKEREFVQFKNAIYGELSPLANESTLRAVAAVMGVDNVDKKDPDIIRIELESVIQANEKLKKTDDRAKGVKEFLDSLGNIDDEIGRRYLLKFGEDHKIIRYNPATFHYEVTESGERLVRIPAARHRYKFDYFCDQVLNEKNATMWEELKHLLVTEDYLKSIKKLDDIKWLCKEAGIKYVGVKFDTVKKQLLEIYGG